MPVISALRRLSQEDHKFMTMMGYIVTPISKKKKVI
jgi:hypothetical protein